MFAYEIKGVLYPVSTQNKFTKLDLYFVSYNVYVKKM